MTESVIVGLHQIHVRSSVTVAKKSISVSKLPANLANVNTSYSFSVMISETGKNLSVLIVTETGMDWQTFATWYSFFKNLPEAKVSIVCHRNDSVPFVYYQWTKRLRVPIIKTPPFSKEGPEPLNWLGALKIAQENNMVGNTVLIVRPHVLAVDTLDSKLMNQLNDNDILINDDVWFVRDKKANLMIDDYLLNDAGTSTSTEKICVEAKDADDLSSIVCYKKGCGRWIDTSKGCPFSNAAGLVSDEMTSNETRVIELWKKMTPLYNAVV